MSRVLPEEAEVGSTAEAGAVFGFRVQDWPAGTQVQLHALEARPAYNGRVGVSQGAANTAGRVRVLLRSGLSLDVRPEKLNAHPDGSRIQAGAEVVVVGLVKAAHLNGALGRVVTPPAAGGRAVVALAPPPPAPGNPAPWKPPESKALQPQNLLLLLEEERVRERERLKEAFQVPASARQPAAEAPDAKRRRTSAQEEPSEAARELVAKVLDLDGGTAANLEALIRSFPLFAVKCVALLAKATLTRNPRHKAFRQGKDYEEGVELSHRVTRGAHDGILRRTLAETVPESDKTKPKRGAAGMSEEDVLNFDLAGARRGGGQRQETDEEKCVRLCVEYLHTDLVPMFKTRFGNMDEWLENGFTDFPADAKSSSAPGSAQRHAEAEL